MVNLLGKINDYELYNNTLIKNKLTSVKNDVSLLISHSNSNGISTYLLCYRQLARKTLYLNLVFH
jgi:hypothetical protein